MKVLLADDDIDVLNSLKELLSEKNYLDVDTAMTCFDAITKHIGKRYDILIIDIDFEDGMNGIEAASIIRKKDKDIKIIVISAYNYTQSTRQAVISIGGDFLVKPIKIEELITIINK